MDIRKYDSRTNSEKGLKVYIEEVKKDSLGKIVDEGAGLILRGVDSLAYAQVERDIARRNIERKGKPTAEELEDQGLEKLVALTVGSFGLTDNGAPFEVTEKNAAKFYKEFPHYAEIAYRVSFNRSNFFPSASESCSRRSRQK